MSRLFNSILSLVGLTLVMACSQQLVWYRPNTMEAEFAQHRYQCMQESGYTGATGTNMLGRLGATLSATGAGLQGRYDPSVQQIRSEDERNRYASAMFQACMESRGYKLVPKQ